MKVTIFNSSKQKVGTFDLPQWNFKSGSVGFWTGVKLVDPATKKAYQVHVQMVEIGSKENNKAARQEAKNKEKEK